MMKKKVSVLFVVGLLCILNGSIVFAVDITIQSSDINEAQDIHGEVLSAKVMMPYIQSHSSSSKYFFEDTMYDHHDPIFIEGNDEFTEENGVLGGHGSFNDPYIIEGWDIYCFRHTGIVLRNISVYFMIKYCHIYGGGINSDGIVFYNVSNGIIDSNIIEQNRYGVLFYPQYPGRENSSNNIISNNTIAFNSEDGISFEHTGTGWHSRNSIFYNNITNNKRGIYLIMSDNNTIAYNTIFSNDEYGIELDRCMGGGEWNIVHHNNLIENKGDQGQVLDWGDPCNYWNDSYPSGGNYWSDYMGLDNFHGPNQDILGSDGIGDVSRPIPEGENQDHYPLMRPWNIVNNPPDKPRQPSGEIQGAKGHNYSYTTNTTDSDGDVVYYLWDWGDGSTSGWLGPYDSGVIQKANHTWVVKGTYAIKVKAKDIYSYNSDWSDPLPITMPCSYEPMRLAEWLFQRFPYAFPMLRSLVS